MGLGADGLSSSSYGPQEAFRALGEHTFLAVGVAAMMAFTVILIAAAYSRIIEQFPHGGGGYVVATKLLGCAPASVSGSALLVDYVLTIATSIAAAGDAIFSFLPAQYAWAKLPFEALAIVGLTTLNIRGAKESVMVLVPIFLVFLVTHVVVIVGGIAFHAAAACRPRWSTSARGYRQEDGVRSAPCGLAPPLRPGIPLGGGTHTGPSRPCPTACRSCANRACRPGSGRCSTWPRRSRSPRRGSSSATCSGTCQLEPGKTANASACWSGMTRRRLPSARPSSIVTLASEGALLVVAAQAGFIDGPRVLANMAVDSWVPHRFSALSDRLTTQNGIVLMGGTCAGGAPLHPRRGRATSS